MKRWATLRKIAPEVGELIDRRYTVLQSVVSSQPIGRRTLAARLAWPERMVRKEIDFLKDAGLIAAEAGGMVASPSAPALLDELREIIRELRGLEDLEVELATRLGLQRVVVVPGNSDVDDGVKKEVALATAQYLHSVLIDGDVVAVTGGTTLAEVARSLPTARKVRDVTVVAARGGLGEDVELQANTVAAALADRLGGNYRLFHVPDDLGEEAMTSLMAEPKIREVLELIRSARIVLHGIGTAEEMARRRGLPAEHVAILKQNHAVGEAFGYYFDAQSRIVYASNSVGLRFEDLEGVELVVAVGGGRSKADAALAVLSSRHQDVYITDEGAARTMLERLKLNQVLSANPVHSTNNGAE